MYPSFIYISAILVKDIKFLHYFSLFFTPIFIDNVLVFYYLFHISFNSLLLYVILL